MVISNTQDNTTVVTLLPNRSASWEETRLFLYLICGTTIAVGIFWAFIGAWVVLPFSGLEASLVAYFIYKVCKSTYQQQVITCSQDFVLIQFGSHFPQKSWKLERTHTHLTVVEPRHHLDALHLSIFDKHNSIELGLFLNKEDKELALKALKQAGLLVQGFSRQSSRTL